MFAIVMVVAKEAERDKSAMPVVLVVGRGEVAVAVEEEGEVGVEVDVEGLEEVLAEVVTRNKWIKKSVIIDLLVRSYPKRWRGAL